MSEVDKLEEYAELQNDEYGEMCNALCFLYRRRDYMDDDRNEFKISLEKQINKELNNFRKYSRIVKKEATTTHTYTELEWDQ